MKFLLWHYTLGLDTYLTQWVYFVRFINHYFSLPLLIKTFFSPWKRLIDVDESPGFNIQRFFEALTFNLISRSIGAIVRFFLFWIGLIVIFMVFFGGAFGVLLWLSIPILGLPYYFQYKEKPEQKLKDFQSSIRFSKDVSNRFVKSDPGKFLLSHLGLDEQGFVLNSDIDAKVITAKNVDSFEVMMQKCVDQKAWKDEYLRRNGLNEKDILLAAKWWDMRKKYLYGSDSGDYFGRPGVGLELLFGYTPTLNQYSINMSAPQSFSYRLIGREGVVNKMERVLNSGASIVLIGKPGVGKKTVVLEFSHRAAYGKLGAKMAYRRILELDYNFLLSGSSDLNRKKRDLAQILAEAAYAGNIILMIRDIQRLTNKDVEGYDFTDVFEEYMEKKDLKIIAVSTPNDYERFISPNLRLRKFLKEVEVNPPNMEEAMEILIESANDWEHRKNVVITINSLRRILELSDRYITETPFPEKALELLEAVVLYKEQSGQLSKNIQATITVDDANLVLAEKTGISFANITESQKKRLSNIESIIHERLVNQETAVNLIGKSLRGRSVGVKQEDKPIGSFLFLGPTGVGKTETAKVLARTYFGSEEEIVRFDMAEYAGSEGLERLIGSVSKNMPGVLTTAIKNKPASLLLIDEIEKSKPEVFNLFLSLLDEGSITDAFGRSVNCSNLFVIATSNAGAEYIRQLVSKDIEGKELQDSVINHILKQGIFSPEFINRFDGTVVYEPLRQEHLVQIASYQLKDLSQKMKQKGVKISFDDSVTEKIAREGYDPAFGARPMKRIIDLELGDLIGKAILSEEMKDGAEIRIKAGGEKDEYIWEKQR